MNARQRQSLISLLFLLLGLVAVSAVSPSDEELMETQVQYCAMVKMYMDTKGEAGWPAYKGTHYCPALR